MPFRHDRPVGRSTEEAGGDGFRTPDDGNLPSDSKRIQGVLLGHYDVSDHVRFHAGGWACCDIVANVATRTLYNPALSSGPGRAGAAG